MKTVWYITLLCLLVSMLLSACGPGVPAQSAYTEVNPFDAQATSPAEFPEITSTPSRNLSAQALESLSTLDQVDDYPLYTMRFEGEYVLGRLPERPVIETLRRLPFDISQENDSLASWGCSLFAALAEGDDKLYGRNFDWEFSPALLLFTSPPDGYASVSMVDIAYLGFDGQAAYGLTELPPEDLQSLLQAPAWPFDGMNSQGLAVGMAAVPEGNMQPDPDKPTLDSLRVMREILDHAADVGEAVEIFKSYNIDMAGGPPLHYLLADKTGKAMLVEFYRGEMRLIPNEDAYHLATNFLLSAAQGAPTGQCWRYEALDVTLAEEKGSVSAGEAMQMLAGVAQDITQWSVVYDMSSLEVHVVAGQQYEQVHWFELK